jgi:hypothetical protein
LLRDEAHTISAQLVRAFETASLRTDRRR